MARDGARLKPAVVKLLAWFRQSARDMPWRRTKDPYAIWVSEIMLQQTQVATVIPYFNRWMKRFPTVRALARAGQEEVLKQWEGLGYYARARNLHRAAQQWPGPETAAQWRELPGVGDYTAAAVASIAHGEAVPVVDGNVLRVMARLLKIEEVVTRPEVRERIRGTLQAVIPSRSPGDFNQAVMELGQRLCTPRSPKCGECPLSAVCRARAAGVQEELPRKPPKRAVPHFEIAVGVCWKGDRVLVARRPADGLLGGLWEFPGGKRKKGETYEQALRREFKEEVGLSIEVEAPVITVPHRYSHFSVELHVFHCRVKSGRARAIGNDGIRWVTLDELDQLAFPSANRRIIDRLLADHPSPFRGRPRSLKRLRVARRVQPTSWGAPAR